MCDPFHVKHLAVASAHQRLVVLLKLGLVGLDAPFLHRLHDVLAELTGRAAVRVGDLDLLLGEAAAALLLAHALLLERLLQVVLEALEALHQISQQVSSFARIDWGESPDEPAPTDAAQTLQGLQPVLQLLIKPAQLHLSIHHSRDVSEPVFTAMRAATLTQVLITLARIAKESVTQAPPEVTAAAPRRRVNDFTVQFQLLATPETITLTIADDGIGMSAAELADALSPDVLGRGSLPSRSELPIIHQQITQEGGQLHLDSQPERGTTITITMPRMSPA